MMFLIFQGLTGKLIFASFIIAFGNSFQFGYNIGVLNQPNEVISYKEDKKNRELLIIQRIEYEIQY